MVPTVHQRSQLLRVAVWAVVFLAIAGVAWLIFEWIDVTRELPFHKITRLVVLGLAGSWMNYRLRGLTVVPSVVAGEVSEADSR